MRVGEHEVSLAEFFWPRLLSTASLILLVVGAIALYGR
jgi:hypothetical protein